eukprot:339142_1
MFLNIINQLFCMMHQPWIICCILVSLVSIGATNLTNDTTITQDYTFTLADSPYYISNNIIFAADVIVEKGVEIIFTANNSIVFNGDIDCGCNDIHTNTRRLVDESQLVHIHHINKQIKKIGNNDNGGIIINNTINSNKSIIQFCDTLFTDLRAAINIITQETAITIDNCLFKDGYFAILH